MLYHKIIVKGLVQGVGFRPHVYRIAKKLNLFGYVKNKGNFVEILINKKCQGFLTQLKKNLPQQAIITTIQTTTIESKKSYEDFYILKSTKTNDLFDGILPQDLKICKECIEDIKTHSRFKHYAFTTCTNCGPRYSILKALPYDRENTTMANFNLCSACKRDFLNPENRRFHAQPLSCKDCHIPLTFFSKNQIFSNEDAITQCALLIQQGGIVAIKGIGGFALACSIKHQKSIQKIRDFKQRPFKPFAIMVKDIAMARQYAFVSKQEEKVLLSKESPIVLLKKRKKMQDIAPNLNKIGIILPYSGLHFLLFEYLDTPIIFTSANQSSEPIITTRLRIEENLYPLYDGILDYDREIANPIDDSLVQVTNSQVQILRLARGYAPLHLKIPHLKKNNKTQVGLGAEQKITLAYRKNQNIILSPYIGDLSHPNTLVFYEKTYRLFNMLYAIHPDVLISDKHKNYHSYDIGAKKSKAYTMIWEKKQHHYAHFCAIFADAMLQDSTLMPKEKVLGILWDGTGMGDDGKIWGGEFFIGNLKSYRRVGHFEEMDIYGGEKSIKEIYKIAYCLAKQFCKKTTFAKLQKQYHKSYPPIFPLFDTMIEKKIQSFTCTSVGRIFDAVAALIGVCDKNTYDSQAPMLLEALYQKNVHYGIYPFKIQKKIIKIHPLIEAVVQDVFNQIPKKVIATKFIHTLAYIALEFSKKTKAKRVLFSGGVFMNQALCEKIQELFQKEKDIKFYFHVFLPSNDSAIALGQVVNLS